MAYRQEHWDNVCCKKMNKVWTRYSDNLNQKNNN